MNSIIESTGEIVTVESQAVRSVMNPEDMKARYDQLKEMVQSVMIKGTDYGPIPGTSGKPTLLKAGAEKLCVFFGLEASFELMEGSIIDLTSDNPMVIVRYRCTLRSRLYGYTVGSGIGVCTSKEKKYANRPVAEVLNTVDKIGQKRSLVAATLVSVGASDFFNQDLEDFQPDSNAAPATPSHWTQDAKAVEKFYLWLHTMGYNPIEALHALGVQSVYDIKAEKKEVIAAINDYYAKALQMDSDVVNTVGQAVDRAYNPIRVDLNSAEEIPYQQTVDDGLSGNPELVAQAQSELEQYLPKKRTSKPLPAGHWLKNSREMGQFWVDLKALNHDRDSLLELVGLDSIADLPMTKDDTWTLINTRTIQKHGLPR